jgi:hypothetical protein
MTTNTNTKEQRLAFLASFSCAVGMAGGYAEACLQYMDVDRHVKFHRIYGGLRLPATDDMTRHMGACYPLLIAATVPGLGKEVADTARMTFGKFVNEVGALYDEYKTAKQHEVFASIQIRGKITCMCRAVIAEVTKLVNGHLDSDVSDVDRLFHYCLGQLVTSPEIRIILSGAEVPAELTGINVTDEMLRAVESRLEQQGYEARGYVDGASDEVYMPAHIKAGLPYMYEEGHPYGVRKVYLERKPAAA